LGWESRVSAPALFPSFYNKAKPMFEISRTNLASIIAGAGQDGPKAKQTVVDSPAGWSNAAEQTLAGW
jgi:hypothetical protein